MTHETETPDLGTTPDLGSPPDLGDEKSETGNDHSEETGGAPGTSPGREQTFDASQPETPKVSDIIQTPENAHAADPVKASIETARELIANHNRPEDETATWLARQHPEVFAGADEARAAILG